MTRAISKSVLADLVARGLPDTEIAARLGVSRNVVIGQRNRAGIAGNLVNATKAGRRFTQKPAKRGLGSKRSAHAPGTFAPNWTGSIGPKATERRQPSGKCRYPHGDPLKPGFHFCESPVAQAGAPYCSEHHAVCYVRRTVAA